MARSFALPGDELLTPMVLVLLGEEELLMWIAQPVLLHTNKWVLTCTNAHTSDGGADVPVTPHTAWRKVGASCVWRGLWSHTALKRLYEAATLNS